MTHPPQPDHHTRSEYPGGVAQALADAERVIADLQLLAQGRTVLVPTEYEFLAARARNLVKACRDLVEGR